MTNQEMCLADDTVIKLTENLKHLVFSLGPQACADIIDDTMASLVNSGQPFDVVTEARTQAYDIFLEFCTLNIGMLALSSAFSSLQESTKGRSRHKTTREGCVYVAKITDGMVKIGRSKDPERRLIYMQNQGRLKFSETFVSAVVPDCIEMETHIHRLLSEKKRTGEWFDITFDEAVSIVTKLAKVRVEGFAVVIGKTLIPSSQPQKTKG